MSRLLKERWKTTGGQELAVEALEFLVGARKEIPNGFGLHSGRLDLRGIALAGLSRVERSTLERMDTEAQDGIRRIRRVRWVGIDFSFADLSNLRIFSSLVQDCVFDNARCQDWRLWDTRVGSSSFNGANLRDLALGIAENGRPDAWINVSFDGANMRGGTATGALFERCTFRNSRIRDADFLQVTMRHCVFEGLLKDVLFDGRLLPDRPQPGVFLDIDFSDAVLEDVEFRGCGFVGLGLPLVEGVYEISNFPRVARRVLELSEGDMSVEARMLRSELEDSLRLPGSDDSSTIYNRRDYVASGGEQLALLTEALFAQAMEDFSRSG